VRTKLSISSHEIQALHFVRPVALDLVAIAGAPEDRQDLPPVPWFGPEVSIEPASQRRRLSSDSVASQRMAMSFAIEFHGGLVNGGIEAFRPCEGLMSEMMLL
jgi:hypothetical protein